YIKDVNPQTAKLARIARLEALMDGGKVVFQPFGKRSHLKSKTIHGEVAGLEAAPTEPTSEETVAPATKKAEDEKKKKDDKKKKKKKKKKKTIKGKGETTPETDDSEDEAKNDSDDFSNPAYTGGPGVSNIVDPNKIPETVEEWLAFLMPSPDFDKTAKFVKFYQNGAIKAEIYYEVVGKMLEDPREKMIELGVMALGSTPSVKSFTMLSDFTIVEKDLARPKAQAQSYMRMYTRLEYLQHLTSAFSAGSVQASMEALKQLEIAIALHLKGAGTDQPTEQDTTPRAPASNVSRYFNPIVGALENLLATSENTLVLGEATKALQNLQSSLPSNQASVTQ
ncbi:MAG: hypothetical protein AAB250_01060, partial [Bdellovibrionota bacterium]